MELPDYLRAALEAYNKMVIVAKTEMEAETAIHRDRIACAEREIELARDRFDSKTLPLRRAVQEAHTRAIKESGFPRVWLMPESKAGAH